MNKLNPSKSVDMSIHETLGQGSFRSPEYKVSYIKELKIGSITAFAIYSSYGERIGLVGCLEAAQKKAEMVNSYWQLIN